MNDKPILLMVTAATRNEAENLGEALLSQGLAKRGSVIPVIHSFWMEAGKLERSHEAMLLVTTTSVHAKQATAYIRAHHSFEAPQIVTLAVAEETTA
ncbi:MAG TPA: divalent cation tolerance protein CutA [Candidatus Dormibacteraeota bacterium]